MLTHSGGEVGGKGHGKNGGTLGKGEVGQVRGKRDRKDGGMR